MIQILKMSLKGLQHKYAVYTKRGDLESVKVIAERMKNEYDFDVNPEKPKEETKSKGKR